MKNSKKAVALGLALATGLWLFSSAFVMVPAAGAATASDIQAQIDALMAQINSLKASLGTTTTSGSSYNFTRNLTVGSTGADVTALQQVLINGGYLKISKPTTYFGALTKAALAKWQAANGVSPAVGFFGPLTRAALASAGTGTTTGTTGTTTGGTGTTVTATGSASVSLASSNPAAGSIAKGAKVKFTDFTFSAGASALTVSSLVVHRLGLSSDSDVQNLYLYDSNNNELAAGTFNNGVVTFTGSPLFTVAAGTSATVEVRADMSTTAQGGTTGDAIGYGITSASDVNIGGGTINGTFPVNGNLFTIAAVTNLGGLNITSTSNLSSTINPGTLATNVGYFQFQGSNQPLSISYIKFTNVGSVAQTDLQNFKLMYNGTTQVGATVQQGADKTVVFNLASTPMVIPSGNTVNLYLVADVLGGSTRTYQFTIQRTTDVQVMDTTYNTGIVPSLASGVSPVPTGTTNQVTVNSGTGTVQVDTNSPTGAVAVGAQGQTLATFDFTGSGENIQVSSITVTTQPANMAGGGTTATTDYLKNGKLVDVTNGTPGVQIGSVQNLNLDSTTADGAKTTVFSIPGYWIIPASKTVKLAVVTDLVAGDATAAELSNSNTGTIYASIGTIVAQGQTSLQTALSSVTATGRTLTLTSSALTETLNSSFPGGTSSIPTGVLGQTKVRIGSFNLTAGSAEAVNVNQVTVTMAHGTDFQNVYAMVNGSQVGQSYGAITATQALTFNPSTILTIPAGGTVVFDVYGDLLAGSGSVATPTSITAVTATGAADNTTVSLTTTNSGLGQNAYISAAGALTVATDASAPTAAQLQQLVAGTTGQTLAVFNLAASPAENINVTKIKIGDTETATNTGMGDFSNLNLYVNGTAVCNGTLGSTLVASSTTVGTATFNMQSCPIVVPAGANVSVYVKGDITQFPGSTPGSSHNINLAYGDVTAIGAVSGSSAGTSAIVAGVTGYVYRTGLTMASDATSPSGASSANATQTVAVFDLTNANNGSAAQATFMPSTILGSNVTSTVDFNINSTLAIPSSTARVFSVYRSTDLTTPVLTATIHTGTSTIAGTWNGKLEFVNAHGTASATFTPTGTNNIGAGSSVGTVTITPQVLNPGQTNTYVVKFDTSDAASTNTFTLSVPTQGTNTVWTDSSVAVSTVTNLPLTFGTLTY